MPQYDLKSNGRWECETAAKWQIYTDVNRNSLEVGPGVWTFFGVPRAISVDGTTYIGAFDDPDANVVLYAVDQETGDVDDTMLDDDPPLPYGDHDDHLSPQINVLDDDRLIATWERNSQIHYRLSKDSLETSFGGIETLGSDDYEADYASVVDTGDRIFMFHRERIESDYRPHNFFVSDDNADSWDGPTTMMDTDEQWGYATPFHEPNNDRIHFVTSDNGQDGKGAGPKSIWYFYFDYDDDTFHEADGTEITDMDGLPMMMDEDLDTVYDASSDDPAWFWDLTLGDDGRPRIAYATFPDYDTHHRYHHARWTGDAWEIETVVDDAGGPMKEAGAEVAYSGGLTIDHENPDVIYASVAENSDHEIRRYNYADGSWTLDSVLANGYRPECVRDLDGGRTYPIAFFAGDYDNSKNVPSETDVFLLNGQS